MTKLIALIDGSIYSESVCDHAAWAADGMKFPVEILHVIGRRDIESNNANLSGSIGLGARTALLEELAELEGQKAKLAQKRGRAILEDAKARIEAAASVEVTTKLRNGDLPEAVAEANAGFLVIGKRGAAADFAKLHLGSNLERVVRSSTVPILVASRSFSPIKRLLIAYDGGASAKKAVQYVAENALFAGMQCHLLLVGDDDAETRAKLDAEVAKLKAKGLEADYSIATGLPETAISEKVETDSINLVVMGAYGHSRIRHMIIGSTTTEMIRSCQVPLILVR